MAWRARAALTTQQSFAARVNSNRCDLARLLIDAGFDLGRWMHCKAAFESLSWTGSEMFALVCASAIATGAGVPEGLYESRLCWMPGTLLPREPGMDARTARIAEMERLGLRWSGRGEKALRCACMHGDLAVEELLAKGARYDDARWRLRSSALRDVSSEPGRVWLVPNPAAARRALARLDCVFERMELSEAVEEPGGAKRDAKRI